MKIFWSWQSDTHGATGRHFVREVLGEAVKQLLQDGEIYDSERDESGQDLHVDHDRLRISGSPDLPATIIAKIEGSALFVADVTPVAATGGGKKVMNPNVGIELGYAWSRLGLSRILMVMNSAYGDRKAMPFDLQSKGGPIFYCLEPSASGLDKKTEGARLKGKLVEAIREFLKHPVTGMNREKHEPLLPGKVAGTFFDPGTKLAMGRNERAFTMSARNIMYIRMRPIQRQSQLSDLEACVAAKAGQLTALFGQFHQNAQHNAYGAISFTLDTSGRTITSLAQLFRNREIWGIDSCVIVDKTHPEDLSDLGRRKVVVVASVENLLAEKVPLYSAMAAQRLQIDGGIAIDVGLVGCTDHRLMLSAYHDDGMLHRDQHWSTKIADPSDPVQVSTAVSYFRRQLFESAGLSPP